MVRLARAPVLVHGRKGGGVEREERMREGRKQRKKKNSEERENERVK